MKRLIFFFITFIVTCSWIAAVEPARTICLNMIVKDEAAVIERALNSVKDGIDYWVIIDTGSRDGTQEIIKRSLSGIPGELHEKPWINFAHNRNEALQLAKEKADYLLFIDADERLVFTSGMDKARLDKDGYFCFVRVYDLETGEKYRQGQRLTLVKSQLNWRWSGEVHETLVCPEAKQFQLLKNVINFADSYEGHRAQDPQKGLKDAQVLEQALQADPYSCRTVFYLAQSYEYAKDLSLALQTYAKRAAMGGPEQEVFWSLFRIGQIQEELQMAPETIIQSYDKAFKNRASRLEPLYYMAKQYAKIDELVLSYVLLKAGLSFAPCEDGVVHETWIYDYGLLLEFAKSACALGQYQESCDAWEKLLAKEDLPRRVCAEAKKGYSKAQSARKSRRKIKSKEIDTTSVASCLAAIRACSTCAEAYYHLAEHFAKNQNAVLAYAVAKAGAALAPSIETQPEQLWIYEYGLINQWATYAFGLQKFTEAKEAFELLLTREHVPDDIQTTARKKIQIAKNTIRDLEKFGFSSF